MIHIIIYKVITPTFYQWHSNCQNRSRTTW